MKTIIFFFLRIYWFVFKNRFHQEVKDAKFLIEEIKGDKEAKSFEFLEYLEEKGKEKNIPPYLALIDMFYNDNDRDEVVIRWLLYLNHRMLPEKVRLSLSNCDEYTEPFSYSSVGMQASLPNRG